MVVSLDMALVKPLDLELPTEYVYGALRQRAFRDHCLAYSNGTTVLHLSSRAFETYRVPLPTDALTRAADAMRPLLARADATVVETTTLERLRDLLAPRLLGGDLCVADLRAGVAA